MKRVLAMGCIFWEYRVKMTPSLRNIHFKLLKKAWRISLIVLVVLMSTGVFLLKTPPGLH